MKAKKKKVERAWKPYYCDSRKSWIVPLTKGLEALIDKQDVDRVGEHKWFANTVNKTASGNSYTYPTAYLYGWGRPYSYLHRFIMMPEKGFIVDHINGNTLDNRRSNMRICTVRENNCNTSIHRSGHMVGTSKAENGAFRSRIFIDGHHKHLGTFKTEHEAHQAYLEAYNELITKEKSAA